MIHPATEVRYINHEKGHGLFATQFIPIGTVTWVRDQLDREISPQELLGYKEELREIILHYSYRNKRGNFFLCWDNARYINHDCNPNTCITAYDLELAVRDIEKDEEITNHYGMLNIIESFTLPDQNGTTVHPDDLLRFGPVWDDLLNTAFPFMARLDQPLRPFISDTMWAKLNQISKGIQPMQSVSTCFFPGQSP